MVIIKDHFLENLTEYVPSRLNAPKDKSELVLKGKNIIKLSNNENPLGSSPKAAKAIQDYLNQEAKSQNTFSVYPDQYSTALILALKKKHKEIGSAEVIIGNGLNSIIETITRLFLRPGDKALLHIPTYQYFEVAVNSAYGETVFVQTNASNGFTLDVDEFIAQITKEVKLIFLCNPNNPTGNIMSCEQIEKVIKAAQEVGAFVYLDETYIEFASEASTYIGKVKEHHNLIVGRTFSKAYGLASLRVGWAVIPKEILHYFRKIQVPFPVSILSIIGAEAALTDEDFIKETVENNRKGHLYYSTELFKLGVKSISSHSNFFCIFAGEKFHFKATELCAYLLQNGVVIRNVSSFRAAPIEMARITIGKPENNERLLQILSEKIRG
ncbi:MAG: histidinol-phosphate transaminase [Candidatus Caenarcaniphilales bacterium]|nr:histidinol-phosphate transaminase [Candidatus Caenarcaniphilales bacterium]